MSFGRAFLDVIIGILCLGIPYLFMHRARHRVDEESGARSHGAMLIIGSCACLVVCLCSLAISQQV